MLFIFSGALACLHLHKIISLLFCLPTHRAMGSLQQALVCFEKRLVVAHELGEAFNKAQAYGELGSLHSQLGNYEQAISCLERQLNIAREMKDRALESDAACGLGGVYQQMGEYDTALQYHQLDLQIAEETNNPTCQGRAYGNLGLTYESLGTFERAVVYQEQHLSIAAQMNDLVAKTVSYSSLGRTHHALQNYSQAVMYLQEGKWKGRSWSLSLLWDGVQRLLWRKYAQFECPPLLGERISEATSSVQLQNHGVPTECSLIVQRCSIVQNALPRLSYSASQLPKELISSLLFRALCCVDNMFSHKMNQVRSNRIKSKGLNQRKMTICSKPWCPSRKSLSCVKTMWKSILVWQLRSNPAASV